MRMRVLLLVTVTMLFPVPSFASTLVASWKSVPAPNPAATFQLITAEAKFTFTPTGDDKQELDYYSPDAYTVWTRTWWWTPDQTGVQETIYISNDSQMQTKCQGKFLEVGIKTIRCAGSAQVVNSSYDPPYTGTIHIEEVVDHVLIE